MTTADVVALLAVGVLTLAALSVIGFTLWLGISPMPTTPQVREVMLALIPETDGELHELGAGWGGLSLALARRVPKRRVVAWELSWLPFVVTSLRARAAGLRNLEVRRANFLSGDLSKAGVLVCYLFTGGMAALDEKLRRERAGAPLVIVTNTFLLRGWTAETQRTVDDLYRTVVARYVGVPLT
ncbi:MAG: hypothetical protein GQE15_38485 [Archangiaceae bacterium]|nr:hypothetical protein [Archangiaceae bacterium]